MTSSSRATGQISESSSHILVPSSIVAEVKSDPRFSTELAFSQNALEVRSILGDPRIDPPYKAELAAKLLAPPKSILHVAATTPDILLTHEYLYLGCSPDLQDQNAQTPMGMALWRAANLQAVSTKRSRNIFAGLNRVVQLFIGQHADVNGTHNGFTFLQLACRAKNWKTIALLLEHGAKLALSPQQYFTDPTDQVIFSELVAKKSLVEGHPRPPRVCPCWSGKTLAECHDASGARIPYPPTYMCMCGSSKPYKRCCALKNSPVFESWDMKAGRILAYTETAPHESQEYRDMIRRLQALDFEEFKSGPNGTTSDTSRTSNVPFGGLDKGRLDLFRLKMIELNQVDPAFAYAMKKCRFPLPCNRASSPRTMRNAHQINWNKAVQEYIDLKIDPRPAFEIEMEAKIGQWGGRLIRMCEGPDCGKVEKRDVEKVLQCSKCQIAVYCSPKCQKDGWSSHKKECGHPTQSPPPLPSQQNIQNYLVEKASSEIPGYDEMVANHKIKMSK